mgnify:CR=1 FL=1
MKNVDELNAVYDNDVVENVKNEEKVCVLAKTLSRPVKSLACKECFLSGI